MAQSTTVHAVKTEDRVENARVESDQEAWNAAALGRKYRVDAGKVWAHSDGRIFELPALPGFAALPTKVHSLVFHSVAQFAAIRVGQTAEGDVAQAVSDAIVHGIIPAAKTNDAYEAIYIADIADRIAKKKPAPRKDADAKVKAAYRALIEKNADHYRPQLFASVVEAAKADTTREAKERKRAKNSTNTAEVVSLDL